MTSPKSDKIFIFPFVVHHRSCRQRRRQGHDVENGISSSSCPIYNVLFTPSSADRTHWHKPCAHFHAWSSDVTICTKKSNLSLSGIFITASMLYASNRCYCYSVRGRTINQLSLGANKVSLKVNISGWHPFSLSICSRLKFHPASETWSCCQIPNLGVVQIQCSATILQQILSKLLSFRHSFGVNHIAMANIDNWTKSAWSRTNSEEFLVGPEGRPWRWRLCPTVSAYTECLTPYYDVPNLTMERSTYHTKRLNRIGSFLSPAFIPQFDFCISSCAHTTDQFCKCSVEFNLQAGGQFLTQARFYAFARVDLSLMVIYYQF